MMIALWVSQHRLPVRIPVVLVGLIFVCIPVGLIARQPDLGTSLLVAASGIFVILLAGIQWLDSRCRCTGGGKSAAVVDEHVHQQQRVLTFLDPESDPLGAGWNIIQSKTAIGSGGIFGKGWQAGSQAQLDFLPESHTDFIIAVLAEELGMGVIICWRCIYL